MDFGPLDVDDEEMPDYKATQWAVDYLRRKHDQPFFLGCGINLPHLPWFAPKKYFDLYPLDQIVLPLVNENDLDDVPPIAWGWAHLRGRNDHKAITSTGNWKKAVQAYLACISFVDTLVGRLLDALDESPYADNTVIVLWGDHGWSLGEKLTWRKVNLWEEANRTPLMMVVPGVTQAGSRCPRPVSLIDLFPTLVEVCGLTPPRGQQEGVSLMPLLKDAQARWDRPALMTWRRGNHSVRSERWRYTRYADGGEELYDHEFDPFEWKNLAQNPQFEHIKKKLAKWLPTHDAPEAPELYPVPGSPDYGK
jgi:arylsulfatase A-like enzyme